MLFKLERGMSVGQQIDEALGESVELAEGHEGR
jgi:hypothetical protein